ncbi:MAG: hypothetical protein ABMA14_20915 [Hyphomonadaceae bacterium]
MRLAHSWLILAGLSGLGAAPVALAQDVLASPPVDLSVTVYRDPNRDEGGFDLNNLNGFALITETRRVKLEPGQHRLRFEGVADGIEPASAIVTGLPSGVIEKNRDAALLSPTALIDSAEAQQGRVILARTDEATGKVTRVEGRIRSQAANGVVFETPDGVEALRCSGMAETFSFSSTGTGLSARPTLSVLTSTDKTIEAVVQISYLARGFDWSADYVANMAAKPGKMNLGAWITLANGNGMSFPNARVQIVAGRLNRESGEIEPISLGQPLLAQCWPQGSTSDNPDPIYIERAFPLGFDPERLRRYAEAMPAPTAAMKSAMADDGRGDPVIVTGSRLAEQEDLGDLKLYRVPDRTTISSRQSKQVRMIDAEAVPVAKIYEARLYADSDSDFEPLDLILRTKNDKKNELGIPLPSGRVMVFEQAGSGATAQRLLAGETTLRDLAIDEETELRLTGGPDIQARQVNESTAITRTRPSLRPIPGVRTSGRTVSEVNQIELSNARPYPVQVEVRIDLDDGQEIAKSDVTPGRKNGQPIFKVTIPANDTLNIRYQTVQSY